MAQYIPNCRGGPETCKEEKRRQTCIDSVRYAIDDRTNVNNANANTSEKTLTYPELAAPVMRTRNKTTALTAAAVGDINVKMLRNDPRDNA